GWRGVYLPGTSLPDLRRRLASSLVRRCRKTLLAVFLLLGCARSEAAGPPAAPPAVPVRIARVESQLLRDTSEYLSALKSRRSVLVQPQVSGWIVSIDVASGAHVTPGTLLM